MYHFCVYQSGVPNRKDVIVLPQGIGLDEALRIATVMGKGQGWVLGSVSTNALSGLCVTTPQKIQDLQG